MKLWRRPPYANPQRMQQQIEAMELENRILYSATPVAVIDVGVGVDTLLEPIQSDDAFETSFATDWAAPVSLIDSMGFDGAHFDSQSASGVSDLPLEVLIVDGTVDDYQQLIDDVLANSTQRRIEIIELNPDADGIGQISQALSSVSNVSALHIVSHGEDGQVELGNSRLGNDNLSSYANQIAGWRDSLLPDSDLLFYGCDLASGDEGRDFLLQLGELCECDVAASTDLTGHALIGGDWELEFQTGVLESSVLFSADLQSSWVSALTLTPADEALVNPATSNAEETSIANRGSQQAVAIDGAGNRVVVWSDAARDGNGWGVFAQRFSADGSTVGSEFQVNTNVVGDQRHATVSMDGTGRFVVAFVGDDGGDEGIFLRRFEADGTAIDASDVLVNTGQTAGSQHNVTVAVNSSGEMAIAWQSDAVGEGVYARQFDMTSAVFGNQLSSTLITVDVGATSEEPSVDINDSGRFVVVWERNGDLLGRRYDHGSDTALSASHDLNLAGSGERQVVVGVQSDNDFVIAYRSDVLFFNGIWTRHFQADGTAYATAAKVSSGNDGESPSISVTGSDEFIVVYQDSDADGSGVFARKYDANRSAQGSLFQVNTTTNLDQRYASVAAIDLDNFVVAWSGNGDQPGETDADGVFSRQYGAPLVVNSNPTDITPNSFSIDENTDTTGGQSLGVLTTSDPDGGETFTYTIRAGGDGALFSIGGVSNDELILDAGVLDFETTPTYTVNVRVTDSASNTYDETLTVSVNDVNETPTVALTPVVTNLDEDADTSSAIVVATIVVTDDALGTESLTLTGADAGLFEIVGNDLRLRAGTLLDFESNGSLNVSVNVDDTSIAGSPDDVAGYSVIVNDVNEAPSDISPNGANLVDGTDTTGGLTIATLSSVDPDLGETFSYLIQPGLDGLRFSIGGINNDELIFDDGVLDLVTQGTYQANVQVTDSGGNTYQEVFVLTVTVGNSAPTDIQPNAMAINENVDTSGGMSVGVLTTSDVDFAETFTYTILPAGDGALFSIGGASNDELILDDGLLDFETQSSYSVTVQVTDSGGNTYWESLLVNVSDLNESPTSISPINLSINENVDTSGGVSLGQLSTTDPDVSDTFSYSIVGGPDAASISLGGVGNDELYLDDGILDFETKASFSVLIQVTDGGGNSHVESITVAVNDINELPTVSLRNTTTLIAENADTSTRIKIADIDITDDALGVNGLAVTGADAAKWEIIGSELYLRRDVSLDYETQSTITATIEVDDTNVGSTPDDSVLLTINIADVDESPIALDDRYLVDPEEAFVAKTGVLANDVDPERGLMTALVVTPPRFGALILDADGSFVYQPDPDFFGVDTFVYQVTDGTTAPSQATVVLEVLPSAPLPVVPRVVNEPPENTESSEDEELLEEEFMPPPRNNREPEVRLVQSSDSIQVRSFDNSGLLADQSQQSFLGFGDSIETFDRLTVDSVTKSKSSDSQTKGRLETSVTEPNSASVVSHLVVESFDALRNELVNEELYGQAVIGTTMFATASFSVGYVIWLVRGGVLLSSMLSSLPAWRMVDPLPVLGYLDEDNDAEDDSLEHIVAKSNSEIDAQASCEVPA